MGIFWAFGVDLRPSTMSGGRCSGAYWPIALSTGGPSKTPITLDSPDNHPDK